MPIYDPDHVEYRTTVGHIQINLGNGKLMPAYWAHPNIGGKLPAVAIIHDWWGITAMIRRTANLFAQTGFYVIVPDLFNGKVATSPEEAMELVRNLQDRGYPLIDAALSALEHHNHCNGDVAAVGIGMGGSLAYEAAILRPDLEAAVSFYGFPQRYFGRFKDAKTPILAFYGTQEPHVKPEDIQRLHKELTAAPLAHELLLLEGVGRDLFSENASEIDHAAGRQALHKTFTFLESFLEGPTRPKPKRSV